MLIGVLAQVEAAMSPFVRPAAGPEGGGSDAAGPDPAQQVQPGPVSGHFRESLGGAGQEDDLGVSISRDELGDDEGRDEDVAPRPRHSSPPAEHPPPNEGRPEKGEVRGKKRSMTDDPGSPRLAKPEKTTRRESSRDKKKVKKKKKKKGGDEFDDLFSSLV